MAFSSRGTWFISRWGKKTSMRCDINSRLLRSISLKSLILLYLYSCVLYSLSKSDGNFNLLDYHSWLVRLGSQDTFTVLSQITLCARLTGSSSNTPNNLGRFLPWTLHNSDDRDSRYKSKGKLEHIISKSTFKNDGVRAWNRAHRGLWERVGTIRVDFSRLEYFFTVLTKFGYLTCVWELFHLSLPILMK